jgi:hypothetical protein
VKARVIVYRAAVTAGAAAIAAGFGIQSAQAQPASAHLTQHHTLTTPQPGDGTGGPPEYHALTTPQPSDPSGDPTLRHVLRAPQPSDPGSGPSLHHVLTTPQPGDGSGDPT